MAPPSASMPTAVTGSPTPCSTLLLLAGQRVPYLDRMMRAAGRRDQRAVGACRARIDRAVMAAILQHLLAVGDRPDDGAVLVGAAVAAGGDEPRAAGREGQRADQEILLGHGAHQRAVGRLAQLDGAVIAADRKQRAVGATPPAPSPAGRAAARRRASRSRFRPACSTAGCRCRWWSRQACCRHRRRPVAGCARKSASSLVNGFQPVASASSRCQI